METGLLNIICSHNCENSKPETFQTFAWRQYGHTRGLRSLQGTYGFGFQPTVTSTTHAKMKICNFWRLVWWIVPELIVWNMIKCSKIEKISGRWTWVVFPVMWSRVGYHGTIVSEDHSATIAVLYPKDGKKRVPPKLCQYLPDYMASLPRRQ